MLKVNHKWMTSREDVLAGKWLNHDGTIYCRWAWHHPRRTLKVAASNQVEHKTYELEEQLLEENNLRNTLPDMARHTAERLKRRAS